MSKRKSTLTGSRAAWYIYWRLRRVIIRESLKAHFDMICFGTGFMAFPNGADPHHVSVEQVIIKGALQ